jgi:hypothetical protein
MMNSNNMRIRMPRAVVAAGLVAAVAAPSAVMAKPIGWDNVAQRYENSAQAPDAVARAVANKPYVLPSSFHSEVTTAARVPVKQPYALPSDFQSEAHHSAPPASTSSNPSVIVREVRNVTQADSHTLAIVLASVALGIALCGTGYALVRLSLIQRKTAESSS